MPFSESPGPIEKILLADCCANQARNASQLLIVIARCGTGTVPMQLMPSPRLSAASWADRRKDIDKLVLGDALDRRDIVDDLSGLAASGRDPTRTDADPIGRNANVALAD
jgi:hypothetical protein